MSLSHYEQKFAELKPEKSQGYAKPHKVCMLLAVMDLIAAGKLVENRIRLDDALRERFSAHFNALKQGNDKDDPALPFFHLGPSKTNPNAFWHPKPIPGREAEFAAMSKGKVAQVRDNISHVELDPELFELLKSEVAREVLRLALENNFSDDRRIELLEPSQGWSWLECEAIVADYFAMLSAELKGEKYNKAAHNRALQQLIDRTKGSIERKHMNISAILGEMGLPAINGYKPYSNYQRNILPDVVGAHLAQHPELIESTKKIANALCTFQQLKGEIDFSQVLIKPPEPSEKSAKPSDNKPGKRTYKPYKRDYIAQNIRNRDLGLEGEKFVLAFEKHRLQLAGKDNLADRIEHVSIERDDLGYDIRSFDDKGKDKLIEVKTTAYPKNTEFFITPNELAVSKANPERYHLYRVFNFRQHLQPQLFTLQGDLEQSLNLKVESYKGWV